MLFFGGHAHYVKRDYLNSQPGNLISYTSGGGGGWGCDSNYQGYNGSVIYTEQVFDAGNLCYS
eukprot:Pgem_evm1s8647